MLNIYTYTSWRGPAKWAASRHTVCKPSPPKAQLRTVEMCKNLGEIKFK